MKLPAILEPFKNSREFHFMLNTILHPIWQHFYSSDLALALLISILLYEWVLRFREQTGFTIQEIADLLGVQPRTVQHWITGDRIPWPKNIKKMQDLEQAYLAATRGRSTAIQLDGLQHTQIQRIAICTSAFPKKSLDKDAILREMARRGEYKSDYLEWYKQKGRRRNR